MGAPARTLDLSLAAFLEWEARQELRHERVGGVIRAMAGGTRGHNKVAINFLLALASIVRRRGCEAFGSDVKVVSPRGDVMYPDVTVRCGTRNDRLTTVDDPLLVVEVLSESTWRHDLILKRLAYKAIPSLRVILYVAQDQARVDVVRRGPDGRWDDDEPAIGLDSVLALPELGVDLPLSELYGDTDVAARGGGPPDEEARET
ncbi:MAG: Uma2 family endonuclease [Geminicoccaceae bacterium]|nr:Uma2 family endonuclease [Geminicoccaceae bacterium]